MSPIARTSYAHDVALWVAGGDQTAFTSALAAHERSSWTGGHTGVVDESVAAFDRQERWTARRLALQGYNVIALPTWHLAGLRSPDVAVGELLVEFKTYTVQDSRNLLSRVGHARPQADRVAVGVEAQWDPEMVRSVFRVAIDSARRRRMPAVMFIGDDFQLEWGDWNACFTSSASSSGEQPTAAGVLRRAGRHLEPSAGAQAEPIVPALRCPGAAVSGSTVPSHASDFGRRSSETAVAPLRSGSAGLGGAPQFSRIRRCLAPMLTHRSPSACSAVKLSTAPFTCVVVIRRAAPFPISKPVGPVVSALVGGSGPSSARTGAPAGCATGPNAVSPADPAAVRVASNCIASPARGTPATSGLVGRCEDCRPGQLR